MREGKCMANSQNKKTEKIKKIKIFLADDHPLVLEGIRACLETYGHLDIVGTAGTGAEALEKAAILRPDIVLLDINMPELNGLGAAKRFREEFPQIRIIILSMHDKREYIFSAMQSGACGYILKDVPSSEVVAAIDAVNSGGTYFSSGISDILLKDEMQPGQCALTPRERDVLGSLAAGGSNKEIAMALDISVRTVETHRKHIKQKLGINSTAGLTRYAIDQGLL